MFEYRGLDDPDRLLRRELFESEVEVRMHLVTGLPPGEIQMGVTFEPFSLAKTQSLVSDEAGCPSYPCYPSSITCTFSGLFLTASAP